MIFISYYNIYFLCAGAFEFNIGSNYVHENVIYEIIQIEINVVSFHSPFYFIPYHLNIFMYTQIHQ